MQIYFDIIRSQQMTHSGHYSLTFIITMLSDFGVYLNLFFILFSICFAGKSVSKFMTFFNLKEIWHFVSSLVQTGKRTNMKLQKLESQNLNNLPFFHPNATTQHHSLGSLFSMSDHSQIIKDDHMPLPQDILARLWNVVRHTTGCLGY